MKNLASFQNNNSKLDKTEMKSVKGGNSSSIVLETMIDICFIDANGNISNVYCDRRRKRIGNS